MVDSVGSRWGIPMSLWEGVEMAPRAGSFPCCMRMVSPGGQLVWSVVVLMAPGLGSKPHVPPWVFLTPLLAAL